MKIIILPQIILNYIPPSTGSATPIQLYCPTLQYCQGETQLVSTENKTKIYNELNKSLIFTITIVRNIKKPDET